ncbi:hypothetical protein KFL_002240100 [Klebsormidium nitens]|uniref:Uncharacterized protein n=1 Tax=Klebsormidium nitens TaxID=105231 RepID=A0A1Y1I924_KLENI|nr:hypothetical protein KFL_002240100 [Klebsormidium nitens]|eukprot:GAQ85207.1 hypothetical protein KFL_002240100 [Klebsormidium nitens]
MSFLSWAADVLEKVDQSAAGLSDTSKSGRRRRRKKQLPDGGPYSDVDGTSEQETDASVDFDGRSQLLGVSESPVRTASGHATWDQGVPESAVAKLAKAPSLTIEQLRSVRRNLSDRREWSQPNLKKAYEESLRKLSQVEAQVSVMLAENEKLRREAAVAAQMNAQELEHLRAETAAAQRTIDEEKNAHTSTRIQAEMRESSLQAENLAYDKALEATQRHSQDKAAEAERLVARQAQLDSEESSLEEEVREVLVELSTVREAREKEERTASRGEARTADEMRGEERDNVERREEAEERGEIEKRRKAGEELDREIARLEERLMQHERNAAKWPSAGQREMELERRLRALNEQLVAKQAQAEAFANERRALDLRLQAALSTRREQQFGRNDYGGTKRGKSGRSFSDHPSKGRSGARQLARFRGSDVRGGSSSNPIIYAAEAVEGLGSTVGRAVQQNAFLRTLTVGYVLVLQLAVVFMLFHAGGGGMSR